MYTLIAVFVHFNRFIDLKINFHTNPYKLASSMLLRFWAPCDYTIRAVPYTTVVRRDMSNSYLQFVVFGTLETQIALLLIKYLAEQFMLHLAAYEQ